MWRPRPFMNSQFFLPIVGMFFAVSAYATILLCMIQGRYPHNLFFLNDVSSGNTFWSKRLDGPVNLSGKTREFQAACTKARRWASQWRTMMDDGPK